ncbi:MAG: 50S ribosomal protein L1, partial [Deltaproteobacteria bacterium]|nr:50S ribosomal protein L1 [Deltaproteobacteria bacterium]
MAGKKYKKAREGYDPTKKYLAGEACALIERTKVSSKWDETV